MTDESLADAVGAEIRSELGAHDARLERLVNGTLTEPERAQLEREALEDPGLAEALQLFTPASKGEMDRLVAAATAAAAPSVRRLGMRWAALPLGALAAAAAALLLLTGPDALPPMSVTVVAGDHAVRGTMSDVPGPRIVAADSEITLSLRPEVAVEGSLAVALFSVREGQAHPVDFPIQTSADGAVRLRGPAGRLSGVESGAATIVLVVGRPGHLPSPEAVAARVDSTGADSATDWHAAQVRVVVQPVRAVSPP